MKYKNLQNLAAYTCLALFMLQVCLVMASWIIASVAPEYNIRSMLGSEGLRWLFGTFVNNISSKVLVWIIMVGMLLGVASKSHLCDAVMSYKRLSDYERMALFVVAWEMAVIIVVTILLAFIPHAVLLSAVGTLLPSSFSASIVPTVVISVEFLSITYGSVTGTFKSVGDVFSAMIHGVTFISPFIVVYMFAAEFYWSLVWAFYL